MFNFVGAQVFQGALQKFSQSGPDIVSAFKSALAGAEKVPGLNIPPLALKIIQDAPSYWDRLPEDQKQALFNALIAAGTKALEAYAKSS